MIYSRVDVPTQHCHHFLSFPFSCVLFKKCMIPYLPEYVTMVISWNKGEGVDRRPTFLWIINCHQKWKILTRWTAQLNIPVCSKVLINGWKWGYLQLNDRAVAPRSMASCAVVWCHRRAWLDSSLGNEFVRDSFITRNPTTTAAATGQSEELLGASSSQGAGGDLRSWRMSQERRAKTLISSSVTTFPLKTDTFIKKTTTLYWKSKWCLIYCRVSQSAPRSSEAAALRVTDGSIRRKKPPSKLLLKLVHKNCSTIMILGLKMVWMKYLLMTIRVLFPGSEPLLLWPEWWTTHKI